MRIGTTTALASMAVPQAARSPIRLAVAGLALAMALSAGLPASAAAPADDRARSGSDGDAGGTSSTGSGTPWPLDLQAVLDSLVAAVASATGETVDATRGKSTAAKQTRQRPPKPFSMNLYRRGDFLSQQTTFWCIPASTQLMMNMMDPGRPDRTRAMQARLYRVGDRLEEDGSIDHDEEFDPWSGMGISEWAGLLNRYDYGPYELAGSRSFEKALRKAARMMRKTGKPVGLVVWRGAHAWVMSGFTATADPAETSDFHITSVRVHDPWFPRTSSFWGRSRGPNAEVSPQVLLQDFKRYGRPGRRNPDRDGRFMLVLPRPEGETRTVSATRG